MTEVLAPDKLLPRAWELAKDLARRPTLLLRYTRLLLSPGEAARLQRNIYSDTPQVAGFDQSLHDRHA